MKERRAGNQSRVARPFAINRPALAFAGLASGVWLIGFPILAGLITNYSAWFNYAVLGAVLLPVLILGMVLLRALAWVVLYAYWPIQALIGAGLMVVMAALIVVVASGEEVVLRPQQQFITLPEVSLRTAIQTEPGRVPSAVFVAAGISLVISLGLLFLLRHAGRDEPGVIVLVRDESPQPKPLTYLQQRNSKP